MSNCCAIVLFNEETGKYSGVLCNDYKIPTIGKKLLAFSQINQVQQLLSRGSIVKLSETMETTEFHQDPDIFTIRGEWSRHAIWGENEIVFLYTFYPNDGWQVHFHPSAPQIPLDIAVSQSEK